MRFIDLFAGMGGFRLALQDLGHECVFSSEIDPIACDVYESNFGDRPAGDITNIPANEIPEFDVLCAGFPCQPFSIIGEGKGFADTRGTLFFDIVRIAKFHRPKFMILENVKRFTTHDGGKTLETVYRELQALGYKLNHKVLNARDFGLPQNRERIIILASLEHPAPSMDFEKVPMTPLSKILDNDSEVPSTYFASQYIQERRRNSAIGKANIEPSIWHENKSGNISILPYSCALRAGASYNYLLVNGIRRLTSRENLRLQGYPESYILTTSYGNARRLAGNSVPVPMIRAVAELLLHARVQIGSRQLSLVYG
jgi:DNA (cytosine-5)-methyltransferase 1